MKKKCLNFRRNLKEDHTSERNHNNSTTPNKYSPKLITRSDRHRGNKCDGSGAINKEFIKKCRRNYSIFFLFAGWFFLSYFIIFCFCHYIKCVVRYFFFKLLICCQILFHFPFSLNFFHSTGGNMKNWK